MPGIAHLTVDEFRARVDGFSVVYAEDWRSWLTELSPNRPRRLGEILRKWQATRPNKMRRTEAEAEHGPPFLEELVALADPHLRAVGSLDLRGFQGRSESQDAGLRGLWAVFQQLSYAGRSRGGRAGSVGISKAILLLTDGGIGPAFDTSVRSALEVGEIVTVDEWMAALELAYADVAEFERRTGTHLSAAAPRHASLIRAGRIYDMALGPR